MGRPSLDVVTLGSMSPFAADRLLRIQWLTTKSREARRMGIFIWSFARPVVSGS
jgi:hypothetical protein